MLSTAEILQRRSLCEESNLCFITKKPLSADERTWLVHPQLAEDPIIPIHLTMVPIHYQFLGDE